MYPDAVRYLPQNSAPLRGNRIHVNCFVHSDHYGYKTTCRSQSVIILYCNKYQILWHSKRETTLEISHFGSEFVAQRIASEISIYLRYKLQMFCIPILGHMDVFYYNAVV